MLNAVQSAIDDFLRCSQLVSVTDLIFEPISNEVIICRSKRKGRMPTTVDVSTACSPSEVVDILAHHTCIY